MYAKCTPTHFTMCRCSFSWKKWSTPEARPFQLCSMHWWAKEKNCWICLFVFYIFLAPLHFKSTSHHWTRTCKKYQNLLHQYLTLLLRKHVVTYWYGIWEATSKEIQNFTILRKNSIFQAILEMLGFPGNFCVPVNET